MALGGSGPVNSNIDLNLFHGTQTEGYNDFASSGTAEFRKHESVNFDSATRIEPIHGAESMGLGTSTFLEGAPASLSAIQRRQVEQEAQLAQEGGLQRKKSLAQRIRGINSRRGTDGRLISPDPSFQRGLTPSGHGHSISSSHSASGRLNESNPFFQDYDDAWDKKGAKIQQAEESKLGGPIGGRVRSSSSPKQSIAFEERKLSNDRPLPIEEGKPSGGGFMNRMKSLRKPRPERRVSND